MESLRSLRICVQAFPGPGVKYPVSSDAGLSRDGRGVDASCSFGPRTT